MKKILKLAGIILVFGAIVVLIALNNYTKKGLPKTKGEILLPNLQEEVRILYDKYGVPHIFVKNEGDLYYAMGFVHAQNRLFQMDIFRRVAEGRMTEIFGNIKIQESGRENLELLMQDKFYRLLGFKHDARETFENLPSEMKVALIRYSQGVNDYIRLNQNNLPFEFSILKYKPEKWQPYNSIAIGRFVAWNLTANWETELLRYLTMSKIGKEKYTTLLSKIYSPGPYIIENPYQMPNAKDVLISSTKRNISSQTDDLYKNVSIAPEFARKIIALNNGIKKGNFNIPVEPASNNWVVSGKKSVSGKPILCNDPHLTHLLPSIFYQVHLVSDNLNVIGVSFPGLPLVVLGHNKNFAWGATTTNADTTDLFVEKVNPDNPNQYLYKGKWINFEKRTEKIYVRKGKKKELVEFEILSTVHGPVINSIYPNFLKTSPPISLCWTGFFSKKDGSIYLGFAKAKNINDFISAVRLNEIPIQNWIFADKEGNIGYSLCGLIPIRKKGDGTYPVPGWTGEYDWEGFVPYDEIPQLYNPEEGYIVTANSKVISQQKYKYIIAYDYPPAYRTARIVELLRSKDKLSPDDMKKFQKDNYSKQGERVAKYFISACEKNKEKEDKVYKSACKFLKDWNYHTDVNSIGATIFYKTYSIAFKNILEDELGSDLLKLYIANTRCENIFDELLEAETSDFFDNIKTSNVETKEEIIAKSFKDAVNFLKRKFGEDVSSWRWGRLNTITFSHPFGNKKFLKPFFAWGPFGRQGGRHIVDMAFYDFGEDTFKTRHGAAYRMIVDMADVENSQMIIDTGQSGHIRSKHFADQINLWLEGKTIPMFQDEKNIRKIIESELILKPQQH